MVTLDAFSKPFSERLRVNPHVSKSVRLDAFNNSLASRLQLNRAILYNAYLRYPVEKGELDKWLQVGRGVVTDPVWCGRHTSFFICREKDVHKGVVFREMDFSEKDAVGHGHKWCNKPSCPRCFLEGWAGHAARAIWGKMSSGIDKGLGEVEHFTVTFPSSMWGLPEFVLRKKAKLACLRRGVSGCLIPHARRIDKRKRVLKAGLHYHGLGFFKRGYDRCRDCAFLMVSNSRSSCGKEEDCNGFEQVTRREYKVDGLIVKIMDRRSSGLTVEESVIKTARYVLSHASYLPSFQKRFYIVSYFGDCSNKRLKSKKIRAVRKCPVCASVGVTSVMSRCVHWGKEFIAKDIGDGWYLKCFPSEEFDESGLPKFADYGGGGSGDER